MVQASGLSDELLLKETVTFRGTFGDLKLRLGDSNNSIYTIDWISDSEFKFHWKSSFANTINKETKLSSFEPIVGFAIIKDPFISHLEISLKAKPKKGYVLFLLAVMIFVPLASLKGIVSGLGSLLILLLIFVMLRNFYRIQENELFSLLIHDLRR